MRTKRHKPPMPDAEPRATCPHFDGAIDEIEKARSANAEMREIIDQWRKQAEYWETMADDMSGDISELQEEIDALTDKVGELEKELSLVG